MATGDLHQSGSVVLDNDGNGTIALIPQHAGMSWLVTSIAIKTNQSTTAVPVPVVEAFVNSPASPANSRGADASGNRTSFNGTIKVGSCDNLYVVFTGGIPGSTGTAVIEGTYTTKGA